MLSDRCLSCPALYCLWRWCIVAKRLDGSRMPLGVEVGLGPGHILLDGDPSPSKGAQDTFFGPCLLWPNSWMDQDATWWGDRPRPRRNCVRWGATSPTERGTAAPPNPPCLLWPNWVARLSYCWAVVLYSNYLALRFALVACLTVMHAQ